MLDLIATLLIRQLTMRLFFIDAAVLVLFSAKSCSSEGQSSIKDGLTPGRMFLHTLGLTWKPDTVSVP